MTKRDGMKLRYNVGITYHLTSPESVERGEAFEHGFKQEPQRMTLREVIEEIENNYVFENFHPDSMSQSIYGEFYTVDYYKGHDEQVGVHIDVDKRFKNHKRASHWLNKVINSKLNR